MQDLKGNTYLLELRRYYYMLAGRPDYRLQLLFLLINGLFDFVYLSKQILYLCRSI